MLKKLLLFFIWFFHFLWTKSTRLQKTTFFVLLGHFLFLFLLTPSNHPLKRRPIKVRTQIAANPVAKPNISSIKKTAPPTSPVTSSTKPSPKKKISKPSPNKKPSPHPSSKTEKKSPLVKTLPQKKEPSLEEIEKTLDSLDFSIKKSSSSLSEPKQIQKLHLLEEPPEREEPDLASHYSVRMMEALESSLSLPEHGKVRAKITVDNKGKVIAFLSLETESIKNEEYLKNTLPELTLPCFNGGDRKEFTVTFCNE